MTSIALSDLYSLWDPACLTIMKNEVVFITGGASGLVQHHQVPHSAGPLDPQTDPNVLPAGFGECIARKVVAAGGQAVIADLQLKLAQSIAKELAPNCLAVQCNVT